MKQRADHQAVAALIGDITRAMVDRPEHVRVNLVTGTAVTLLEVSVAAGDIGKLVGRGGRSAVALRQILFAIGGRTGTKLSLEIIEPNRTGSQLVATRSGIAAPAVPPPRVRACDFDSDPVGTTGDLIERVARELVDHGDRVALKTLAGSQAAVYEIHLDQRDVPRFLGKRGRTATALREILWNLGRKSGLHFVLEVVEPIEKVE